MNLNQLNSLEIISKSFNIHLDFLQSIHNNIQDKKYIEFFNIPKKNPKRTGEYREVIKINSPYNLFYKELLEYLPSILDFSKETNQDFIIDMYIKFLYRKNNMEKNM